MGRALVPFYNVYSFLSIRLAQQVRGQGPKPLSLRDKDNEALRAWFCVEVVTC
jgi:hypothetical protein